MSDYENGTVYGKYIKIKKGTNGVRQCADYINDPVKINPLLENGETEVPSSQKAIHYLKNNPKTIHPTTKKRLVSGHNCSADTAAQEFSLIEKVYHSHKNENLAPGQTPNQAFHIILSYKRTDIAPEIVHEMGCEFARRLCGDEFQAVVATHLNTNNYHNHVLVNAYALDGRHKFKDSYHVYNEFRRIVNEISLEYGLPVFIHGEKEKPHKSWKEFIATEEGESWKQKIIHDLNKCVSLAASYEETLKLMEEKGYEIQHNPKSITFKKGGVMVRDRRLGYAYTYEGICHYINQRIHNELWKKQTEKSKERQLQREKRQEKEILYSPPYISHYNQYGKKRSMIVRFLMTIKESLSQVLDEQNSYLTNKAMLSSIDFKKAEKQLKQLDSAIKIADQYNIPNMTILEMRIRELHAKNSPYQRAMFNLEDYLENAGRIKRLIEQYRKLEPVLVVNNLDKKEIIFIPDTVIIQENRAKLNPMRAKTRSDLFQTIHNSRYRLTRKFKTITETEACQIIKAIQEEQKENLPDGLSLGRNVQNQSQPKNHSFHKNIADSAIKRTPVDLNKYNHETKQSLLEFKEIADKLASYGLTTEHEMNDFLRDITAKINELDEQKSFSREIALEIKTLFRLKKTIEQFSSDKWMITEAKSALNYDTLQYMQSRLNQLPVISQQVLDLMTTPHPDEYRFIHDLLLLYPEKSNLSMTNPKAIHHLIIRLKSEQFFEKEIKKALEKEKGEKTNGKDNAERN